MKALEGFLVIAGVTFAVVFAVGLGFRSAMMVLDWIML